MGSAVAGEGKGNLYPDVRKVFAELGSEGYHMFIASNGITGYLEAFVVYYGLDDWVPEIFSIEQAATSDKGELVRMIIEKYGVTEGAVVGDGLSDIRAAKTNGLFAVGCRFGFAQEQELKEADAVIDGLADLRKVLEQAGAGQGVIKELAERAHLDIPFHQEMW